MSDRPVFTYQTRLAPTPDQAAMLDAYAVLHGRAERSLFAVMRRGGAINDLKRDFLARFGITARQFNAIRVGLEGKIASIKERRPRSITEGAARIRKAEKVIARLETRAPGSNKLHQKKRRLADLRARQDSMQADHASNAVHLCFGSRRLFRAQFDLEANGYTDHAAWKADWQASRSNQFFVLGSGDESAGNQTCQAAVAEDGTLTLRLRLPNDLGSGHLEIPGVRFAYGQEAVIRAIESGRRISAVTKSGKPTVKRAGAAISYRFLRDEKGWRLFASVEAQPVPQTTNRHLGALGVDTNADHLAVSETDRFGNLISAWRIDLSTYGKTADQALARIGDAGKAIAQYAKTAGKPIVIEKLDFWKKKAELEATDPAQARMISSFACNKIIAGIKAACFRAGVEVIEANPAYTSVVGAVNHAQQKGISIHQGAAYAIARRGLGLSERPTVRTGIAPTRNGGHVTFALPARNRAKHVWSFWSSVRTRLKAAHGAHHRSGFSNGKPAPLAPETRSACSHRSLPAKSRHANRDQHCSPRCQNIYGLHPVCKVRNADGHEDKTARIYPACR